MALSPHANYTDWATPTCRLNLVPTFADRGMSRDQRGGSPTAVNLSFLDGSRYFYFKQLLIYPHKGWVDPVTDPLLLRKSGSSGDRTRDLETAKAQNQEKMRGLANPSAFGSLSTETLNTKWSLKVPRVENFRHLQNLKNSFFWDVTQCGSCKYPRFRGT
jgi:hypothetical protein